MRQSSIDWEARARSRRGLDRVRFPEGWEIPQSQVFKQFFRRVDFSKEIQRGVIRAFSGKPGDWPRFKQSFYESVHVQEASILAKCEALDALVPESLADQYFFGLSVTPHDYCTRLERLVRKFDREDAFRDNL